MEVVGLVASVITLIGAASLTSSTIHRAWGLRGSPPYLATALNEVNDFKALLEFIRAALTDTDDLEEHAKSEIKRLLDRANEKLHVFDEYLKTKVLRDGEKFDSNARLRKSAKLREVIGEGQVQVNALQQELNSVKMNLMLAINISQL
jgi:vacuolar-type H+-ATPase subunit H